ncbi:MAG: CRTAC1 family protein [Pirellulaceae bacterium]
MRILPRPAKNATARLKQAAEVVSTPFFKEATDTLGLSFRHWCGDSGTYFVPESMGSGIALLDYDRDGDLDIYAVQGVPTVAAKVRPAESDGYSPTSRLFRQTNGRFEDVTEAAGLADELPYGDGVAVGDINNDGWPDLFVSKYGNDRLYLNREGKFEDITAAAGIDNPRWGASACFADYDRDGWLDLFIVNYYDYYPSLRMILPNGDEDYPGPHGREGVPSKLYRNVTGETANHQTQFRDVSIETGIDGNAGPGLGVVPADFNGDGWIDFYVANDAKANFLWVNHGGKTFSEEGIQAGAAYNAAGAAQASMGVAAGDVDGDGRQDLFMTHLEGEYATLYLQVAKCMFEDRSAAAALLIPTSTTTGFGTAMADLDQDGDLDLIIGNGSIRRPQNVARPKDPRKLWEPYAKRNQVFVNNGTGIFSELAGEDGFIAELHVTRGLAVGDIDNDGDLDVVTSEVNGPARIFLNVAEPKGNWLLVKAIDPRLGGRDAHGATVTVTAGKLRISRDINPTFSYFSSNDPRAHFGLGKEAKFDQVEVLWPDGQKESFPGGAINSFLTLRRGEGTRQ